MPPLRSILLFGLPLASLALAQPVQEEVELDGVTSDELRSKLRDLPQESIESALQANLHPKYRDGVFVNGHDAIEVVHSDDPELASRLVDLAKQDAEVKEYLRKRQNSNTTSVPAVDNSPPTTQTTTTPVIVTDSSTTAVSFTTSTDTQAAPTTQQPTTEQQSPTQATTVAVPTTNQNGQPTTTEVPVSSTIAAGNSISASTLSGGSGGGSTGGSGGVVGGGNNNGNGGGNNNGNGNGNSGGVGPVITPSRTQSGFLVPVAETSTNANGQAVTHMTNAFETAAPTSAELEITTTNNRGQTITTRSMVAAAVITTTNAKGQAVPTTSPLQGVQVESGGRIVSSNPALVTTTDAQGDMIVLSSPTPGGVYTTTDAQGQVVTITYQPGGGTVSQLQLETTILPNGQRSTITSFAVVGQATHMNAQTGSAGATGTNTPGLQSGAAMPSSWYAAELAVVLGAAIGVAAIVL